MPLLVITVDIEDPDDVDWLRHKCVPPVENAVAEAEDEHRLDGGATVAWEVIDD
jgi:hypothetical protein